MSTLFHKITQKVRNSYKVQKLLSRFGLSGWTNGRQEIKGIEGPLFYEEWRPLIPPRSMWVWPPEPLSQFFRWVWTYPTYLTLLCDLRPESTVLELACSHGRTMLALVHYLRPPGRYEGLDILRDQIEFAQQNIHTRHPHFNFTLADIHHGTYNPEGRVLPEKYRFPYPDNSFDVVYAGSLFTHLLPPATANYFKESRRVLRKGGRCLFSFFILDYYRGPGTTVWEGFQFNHTLKDHDGVAVRNPEIGDDLAAYNLAFLEKLAADAGLRIVRVVPGSWSNNPNASLSEQDLILLETV